MRGLIDVFSLFSLLYLHGGHQAEVNVRGGVEFFDNLDSLFGFGVSIQPAVVQPLCHTVALQHI